VFCRAGLRGAGVTIEGHVLLDDGLGKVVSFALFDNKLVIVFDLFNGKVDLEDLGIGKLREEGGSPHLGCATPDLLNLTLSSSPKFVDMLARLLLYPTVSTFVQPYYKGINHAVGLVPTTREF